MNVSPWLNTDQFPHMLEDNQLNKHKVPLIVCGFLICFHLLHSKKFLMNCNIHILLHNPNLILYIYIYIYIDR